MLVRVRKHPTLGILVASNGMAFNRARGSKTCKWTFGNVTGRYALVGISGRIYTAHRLVAETFLPNPEGKALVDHILHDTHDNNVCQIRWATPSENNRNRVDNIGIAELLDTNKSTYKKAWYSMNTEKAKQWYWKKREAGFHIVRGAERKQHWEKI